MADFRKISVLAALVLLLGMITTVSAQTQPLSCNATAAVPPLLRSEGFTELAGDIVLDCTGGTPVTAGTTVSNFVNFAVFLNTNVTSRLYNSSGLSEVLLLVDEPTTVNACTAPPCNITGTGGASSPYLASGAKNAFYGYVSGNSVTFNGIPIDAPGTTNHRIFRITNIRANANGIAGGPSGTPGSIQALISASGSTSLPINNPTQIIGFVQSGLTFTLRKQGDVTSTPNTNTDIAQAQCTGLSRTNTSGMYILQFGENFPTAFKLQGTAAQSTPGTIYNTESGFTSANVPTPPTTSGLQPGLADSPTRVKAIFNNIPAGVNVYVSTTGWVVSGSSATSALNLITGESGAVSSFPINNTDFGKAGGLPSGATGLQTFGQLAVVNGTATAVYDVTYSNTLQSDNYYTVVKFNYSANAAQNSPAPGTATVTGSFAPTPDALGVSAATAAAASQTLPIPRFALSTNSRAILNVFLCRTNLLFPFVTNQAGFDTGLAIANTSLDTGVFIRNTDTQTGACTIFPFGDNAPASFSTGTVAPGKVWVDIASSKLPNFQGYIIAQCAFQFAHGFAFISDFRAQQLAMGYLSLVIPEPGQQTRPGNTPAGGESLAQ